MGSRSRLHHTTGNLTVRVVDQDVGGVRVGLPATRALPLSGDEVRIEVYVAPGAWLQAVETTGTVAYEPRGIVVLLDGRRHRGRRSRPDLGGQTVRGLGRVRHPSSNPDTAAHGTGKVLMQEKVVLGRVSSWAGT